MSSSSSSSSMEDDDERAAQLSQLISLELDFDFAFRLQLEEAMAISLSQSHLSPSSSSSESPESSSKVKALGNLGGIESKRLRYDDDDGKVIGDIPSLFDHDDGKVIGDIPSLFDDDDDDDEFDERIERPFGEGSSSSTSDKSPNFRVYFKGMVDVEMIQGSEVTLTGIGVAICDPKGQVLFELSKPLVGSRMGRQVAEMKALIEGLERALALNLKRITFCCPRRPIYLYAKQIWQPNGGKMARLMKTVEQLQKRFDYCRPSLVARRESKFAIKLAKNAIAQQKSRPIESNNNNKKNNSKLPEKIRLKETCRICLEERDQSKIFTIDGCRHRYCFSCMKKHVEAKLSNRNRVLPKCPHETCKSQLNVDSCGKFLTPKQIEIMKAWIREVSMPIAERVYCPYPKCSALMSKREASDFARKENVRERMLGARKCMNCHGLFCDNCKVQWHENMTCKEYKRLNPYPRPEDVKLKSLASSSLWRQCVKCNHMIELAEGCYHMTCRCGHEFCYNCGAEWRQKKATCSCPLWDEDNILFDGSDSDEEDDDDYDDDDDDDDDDSYYSDSAL